MQNRASHHLYTLIMLQAWTMHRYKTSASYAALAFFALCVPVVTTLSLSLAVWTWLHYHICYHLLAHSHHNLYLTHHWCFHTNTYTCLRVTWGQQTGSLPWSPAIDPVEVQGEKWYPQVSESKSQCTFVSSGWELQIHSSHTLIIHEAWVPHPVVEIMALQLAHSVGICFSTIKTASLFLYIFE